MAAKLQQDLDHTDVTLVDPNVEGGLAALVASVEVSAPAMQQLDDLRFISEGCMVHGTIPILVLQHQNAKHLAHC